MLLQYCISGRAPVARTQAVSRGHVSSKASRTRCDSPSKREIVDPGSERVRAVGVRAHSTEGRRRVTLEHLR